jgi:hypothetical protein
MTSISIPRFNVSESLLKEPLLPQSPTRTTHRLFSNQDQKQKFDLVNFSPFSSFPVPSWVHEENLESSEEDIELKSLRSSPTSDPRGSPCFSTSPSLSTPASDPRSSPSSHFAVEHFVKASSCVANLDALFATTQMIPDPPKPNCNQWIWSCITGEHEWNLFHLIQKNPILSIYRGIPENRLYRLFIDQKRWTDPRGGLFLTRQTFDYKEPGYLNAMKKAFIDIMSYPKGSLLNPRILTPELIIKIHSLAVKGVKSNSFDSQKKIISTSLLREGFRTPGDRSGESFGLNWGHEAIVYGVTSGATVSKEGVTELVGKFQDSRYTYKLIDPGLTAEEIDRSDSFHVFDAIANKREFINFILTPTSKHYSKKPKKESQSEQTEEIQPPTRICLRPVARGASLKPQVQTILHVFHRSLKTSEDDKYLAVARLVQDLDQIHPFYDGNIRVFGILLLNRLLIDFDLSPTCLPDPNCLDALSLQEIVDQIRRGQAHFRDLKKLV